jgi:undecaprenyl-diphosphatase
MGLLSYLAENFDLPILDWIAEHIHCGFLDTLMPWITKLGDGGIFWIITAVILMCIPKYRKAGLSMGAALLMGLLVCNLTLKPLVARMRPYDYQAEYFGQTIQLLIETPHDFSFPSGHTIACFEGAVALMLHDKRLGIPALVIAVLVAFSRLYLYVHYPTDVLASVVLGTCFAILATVLVKKLYPLWENRKKIA